MIVHKERPFFKDLVDFMISGEISCTSIRIRRCNIIL